MSVCSCDTVVADSARTCPRCGKVVNPGGRDPGVLDHQRSAATIANLRSEAIELRERTQNAEHERDAAASESERLRVELAQIAAEHADLLQETRALHDLLRTLDERSHLLRARLDALGVSTYRPFEASQASLFDSTATRDELRDQGNTEEPA